MNRKKYVKEEHVAGFIEFLKVEIVPGNTVVPFIPRVNAARVDAQLRYGYDHYLWNRNDFTSTAALLADFSMALNNGLRSNDNQRVLTAITNIQKWGLTPNAAAHNIETYNRIGMEGLRNAMQELLSDNPDIDAFRQLPYNSGFTKIYALIKPDKLPIYDSRVSAMMGYLVAVYCQRHNLKNIPDQLLLYCMPFHKNRRPSYGENRFPTTNNNAQRHARGAIRCGWILNEIKEDIATCWKVDEALSVRAIESALFYAGGSVVNVPLSVGK
jgi:hypothetical protein